MAPGRNDEIRRVHRFCGHVALEFWKGRWFEKGLQRAFGGGGGERMHWAKVWKERQGGGACEGDRQRCASRGGGAVTG